MVSDPLLILKYFDLCAKKSCPNYWAAKNIVFCGTYLSARISPSA
jgi:hypothetical protein